jgi:hypothetical protein
MVLDAGLGGDFIARWMDTSEGMAFLAASVFSDKPWGGPIGTSFEAFANVCAWWYFRRTDLQQHDPLMYQFAQQWLPK